MIPKYRTRVAYFVSACNSFNQLALFVEHSLNVAIILMVIFSLFAGISIAGKRARKVPGQTEDCGVNARYQLRTKGQRLCEPFRNKKKERRSASVKLTVQQSTV